MFTHTVAFGIAFLVTDQCGAQPTQAAFPSKPIRLIVPFSAGGTPDTLARMIGPRMSERWGQPVVVDNRSGAGGTLGAGAVAKATADGYTLLLTSPSFVFSAALQPILPYDPIKDFAGVAGIGYSTSVLVTAPPVGVRNVKELIALARAQPGKILFSSSGADSAIHMNGEKFRLLANIKTMHVGFKGQPEALLEVVAGRIHFMVAGLGPTLPFVKDGRLLPLAVVASLRSPLLPDVPLITDTLPGFRRDGVQCVLAPAATAQPIRGQISTEIGRVLALAEVKERLQNIGFSIEHSTPEALDKAIRVDIAALTQLVKDAGLKPK
jgi:tripartite-type tricarboxylate transporter receptor subunit TctC